MQNSERMLVPLPSELAGLRARDGRIDVPRLLAAAAFGLALEAQRRLLDAAAAVAGRFGWPLRVLARPAVAVARGSVAVARGAVVALKAGGVVACWLGRYVRDYHFATKPDEGKYGHASSAPSVHARHRHPEGAPGRRRLELP